MLLHESLMNVHEISFFMRHTVISLKEDKMYQTFHKYRGIPGFNFWYKWCIIKLKVWIWTIHGLPALSMDPYIEWTIHRLSAQSLD